MCKLFYNKIFSNFFIKLVEDQSDFIFKTPSLDFSIACRIEVFGKKSIYLWIWRNVESPVTSNGLPDEIAWSVTAANPHVNKCSL